MKRALLFSGGKNVRDNYPRYLNNLAAFYKLLLQNNYPKSEIKICSGAGGRQDLDGDNIDEDLTRGSREQLVRHLKWLAATQKDDTIVFVASNHGDENGLCVWGEELVTPQELNGIFKGCEATKIFIFGQCHSGLFGLKLNLSNAIVCCACTEAELSHPLVLPREKKKRQKSRPIGEPPYDEFLFHMVGALSGQYPHVSVLPEQPPSPPKASTIYDAFEFAFRSDRTEGAENPLARFFPEDQDWAKRIHL